MLTLVKGCKPFHRKDLERIAREARFLRDHLLLQQHREKTMTVDRASFEIIEDNVFLKTIIRRLAARNDGLQKDIVF